MPKKYQHSVPIDHMVFTRSGPDPIDGLLQENFSLSGNHVLLVDDAVMETVTSRVMTQALHALEPRLAISLLAVDIDPDTKSSGYLNRFTRVYTFDE